MPSPSAVLGHPEGQAAREQAWRLLWQRLLQPIPDDDTRSDEQDDNDASDAA